VELSILNLLLVLLAAFAGGRIVGLFGYPAVLGEIMVGILLGPPLLGWIEGGEALTIIAQLGVLTMMVYIGMEIDLRELRRASLSGLLVGIGGFVLPFAGGYAVATAFGVAPLAALLIGTVIGVTSLATKSRILVELGLLDARIAHVMMAAALIADTLALIAFAGVVSVYSSGSIDVPGLLLLAARIVGFFAVTIVVGRWGVPWLFRTIAARGWAGRTQTLTIVLIVGLGFAEMAELAGLHGILGAFLAGLFVRDAIRAKRLSVEATETVKDVSIGFLAPVFFVMAGFDVSFAVFRDALPLLLSVVAVAVVGKLLGAVLFTLPTRSGWREGVTVGIGMNGRGGTDVIIAGIALQLGVIDTTVFSVLVFTALATTSVVPMALKWAVRWLDRHGELVRTDDSSKPVLLVGAGPLARRLAIALGAHRSVRVLDLNAPNVAIARRLGVDASQGDALDADVLARAGVEDAAVLVAATPNPVVNVLVAQRARDAFLVPRVVALMKPDVDAGLADTLASIGGRPLFGGAIDTDRWRRVATDATGELVELDVDAARAAVARAASSPADHDLLPLVVRRGDAWRPFDDPEGLLDGDVVYALSDPSVPAPAPVEAPDA
jgi:Kef-type K+ transport system membrane component KefB